MSIEITLPSPSFSLRLGEIKGKYENLYEKAGVYFLFDVEGRLLYIGKSINLYTRINQHIAGHGKSVYFSELIFRVNIILESDALFREIYETFAINTLYPLYNSSKAFNFKRDDKQYELETKLDTLISEREFMQCEIYRLAEEFRGTTIYDPDSDLSQEEYADLTELTDIELSG